MRTVLVAALLLALPAGPAVAATVEVARGYEPGYKGSGYWWQELRAFGSPDDDDLRIAPEPAEPLAVRVADARATNVTGAGCTVEGADALCALGSGYTLAQVDVGDGADRVLATATKTLGFGLHGGAGDDDLVLEGDGPASLYGGDGDDALHAGEGDSDLFGGPGADEMIGGKGTNRFREAGDDGAPDLIDGGEGMDAVWYLGRPEALVVDLAAGVGGASGEGDTLRGIEDVWGGEGAATLLGDDGPNRLYAHGPTGALLDGRGGDDELHGSSGADRITGGAGNDRILAGEGHDVVDAGDGDDFVGLGSEPADRATVRCGPGTDVVSFPTAATIAGLDCETISFDAVALRPALAGGRLVVTVGGGPCGAQLRGGGRRIRARVSPARGTPFAIPVTGSGPWRIRVRIAHRCAADRLMRRDLGAPLTFRLGPGPG